MSCRYWFEDNNSSGQEIEICKKTCRRVICCAEKSQCPWPELYEERQEVADE